MSKCFVRTSGDRTSGRLRVPRWPAGQPGHKGRRARKGDTGARGYAGHRCDGRLPGLRRPQLADV